MKEVQDGLSLNLPSLPLGLNAILVSVSGMLGRGIIMKLMKGPGVIQALCEEI